METGIGLNLTGTLRLLATRVFCTTSSLLDYRRGKGRPSRREVVLLRERRGSSLLPGVSGTPTRRSNTFLAVLVRLFYEGSKSHESENRSTPSSRGSRNSSCSWPKAPVSAAKIATGSVSTLVRGVDAFAGRGRKVVGQRKKRKQRKGIRGRGWNRRSIPYISPLLCISQAMEPLNPPNESIFLSPIRFFFFFARDPPRGKSRRIAYTNGRSWPSDSPCTALLEFMCLAAVYREFSFKPAHRRYLFAGTGLLFNGETGAIGTDKETCPQ